MNKCQKEAGQVRRRKVSAQDIREGILCCRDVENGCQGGENGQVDVERWR